MNLQRKLEEIRRKPAHIRLRYTYAAVAISMFFILVLWFFSLSDSIKKAGDAKKQNVFEELSSQKKSLEDATSDVKKSLDDLNANLEKTTQTTPESTLTADQPSAETDSPTPNTENQITEPSQPPLNNTRPLPDVIKP
jgi:hypothetical protein